MVKKLRRKISVLLVILLATIWMAGLVLFNYGIYQDNLGELRSDFHEAIKETGWKDFLQSGGESTELEGIDYCIFQIGEDEDVRIFVNHYPGLSEKELLEYGRYLSKHWRQGTSHLRTTYIFKQGKKLGKYIVLISGRQAFLASLPMITGSFVAAVAGIIVLMVIAKRLSDLLVRPVDEAVMSEKKFMSNTSHELKTPLTVIRTNAELLHDEIGENKHLQYIQQETNRMISMVNQMLTLMRLDGHEASRNSYSYRVDEALYNVIYPMESIAYEKKLQIDTHIQEGMCMTGDEEQMKQLVSILLDNAVSYSPEGGCIVVEAEISAKRFILSVSNPGEAISEKDKERLFERFYRKDEAREETGNHFGLGLSIAGSIVANHHGKITVESKNGRNIFRVNLPVTCR
ncbi:MAG: sensor histidine kinase [Agathobacter sp.]